MPNIPISVIIVTYFHLYLFTRRICVTLPRYYTAAGAAITTTNEKYKTSKVELIAKSPGEWVREG